MTAPTELDPESLRLLRTVREARFAGGLSCVHCAATAVIRWGRAHGRQRYRCRECRRTFSDLTNTPFMYSKRLAKWPRYLLCVEAAASVRRSAAVVGIHPSTAFHWRHWLLDSALDLDDTRLSGLVEVTSFRMRYSEKGSREESDGWEPRVHVVCARDRRGAAFALPRYNDRVSDFAAVLHDRIDARATVLTDGRRLTGAGLLARRYAAAVLGCARYHSLDSRDTQLEHIGNVMSGVRRFQAWLRPFRGVATKYLPNYLVWHRRLDGPAEGRAGTKWIQATSLPPTLPANSAAGCTATTFPLGVTSKPPLPG